MKKILFSLTALFVVGLLFQKVANRRAPQEPLQFKWSSNEHLKLPFDDLLARNDPLQAVWSIYTKMDRSKDYEAAKRNVEKLIAKYNLRNFSKLTYGYSHDKLQVGWWSGMDMFFAPIVLLDIAEHVGGTDYKSIVRSLIKTAIQSPEVGGSIWPDDGDGCWISEYSWPGMTRAEEYYVLNGHLFALTALKLLSDKLNDDGLRKLFDCAVKGTKSRAGIFTKSKWPLYMLNAPTIDPPHYLLYEAIQFSDLSALTKDPFFSQQALLRKDIIAKYYPVYRVNTSTGIDMFFSSSGAPHPYNLDLFETTLKCDDQESSTARKRGFLRAAFIRLHGIIPTQCSVTSHYMDHSFEMFKATWFRDVTDDDRSTIIAAHGVASLDAVNVNDGWIKIDPTIKSSPPGDSSYIDVEGRVDFRFPERPLNDASHLTFEVETDATIKMGIRLFSGDKMIQRYILKLSGGQKHLVALSKVGFDNSDDFNSVDRIMLYVLTDKMKDVAHIRVSNIAISANQYEMYQTMKRTDAVILQER
jgi:hypothetical protein